MRTLPTGSVDPNFGRRVRNRRQLNSLQNTWPYGYSMPIAVRYTQDAFSRSGWLWPVDAKGEPLKASIFFFQAEDVIRDKLVTGVQTCALPISFAETDHLGADRQPVRGRGLDHRQVPEVRQAHLQRARDRRRRERQDVHLGAQLLEAFLVTHPEPLLLVDHDQAEVAEQHVAL